MPSKSPREQVLNFDIDTYLNPIVPPSQLFRLPKPIAHFLGHRTHTPSEPPHLISYILAYFSTVAGLCLVAGVYNYSPGISKWNPPPLVASFGASAVLDYNTIRSPLAQPRNTIIGHTLSAVVAVAISKGFQHYSIFPEIDWAAAAIACATANLVMSLTNTIHPPGGATAILACIQSDVIALGWMYVPLILLASILMCTVACLFNNTLRWYPTHWWSSAETGQAWESQARKQQEEEERRREEKEAAADLEKQKTEQVSDAEGGSDGEDGSAKPEPVIRVAAEEIFLPSGVDFRLSQYEREFLGELQERLKLAM